MEQPNEKLQMNKQEEKNESRKDCDSRTNQIREKYNCKYSR